ncbi:MAG: hypothetical protein A2428_08560 [Bdellovibrionales bacterium RIFOXYC1_FULL_54_43]|nr:MAG: hypothetical protein A2428_08560 [Bdellovibrionales bacterium RIFOXYC1_FULL_54_43]OFZ84269.1 MAG: hypothetical protein A2603_15140 [Bdellovibrionales bacterium RIFOXYD1_FULL_55_31]
MKNILPLLMLFLVGCNDMKQFERQVERTLGIPVTVKADSSDKCAVVQVQRFLSEYKALSNNERTTMRSQLRERYTAIEINPTRISQTIKGDALRLNFTVFSGKHSAVMKTKMAIDGRKKTGTEPVMKLIKTGALSLTPEATFEQSNLVTLGTSDEYVFDYISSEQTLNAIINNPEYTYLKIWRESEDFVQEMQCAQVISLADLL